MQNFDPLSKMLPRHQMLKRMVIFLFFPIIVFLGIAYQQFLLSPLPISRDFVEVRSLHNDTLITRTEDGITYISAQTDWDAYFATGYAHAQDRLWQLEVQKRLAQGRLSEVFGESTFQVDAFMRTLGFYPVAQETMKSLSPEALSSLEAYSQGINSFIRNAKQFPIEFSLLDIEPEPWDVSDSIAWSNVFALSLSGNFREEMLQYISEIIIPPASADDLFNNQKLQNTDRHSSIVQAFSLMLSKDLALQSKYRVGGTNTGSNAWAISNGITAEQSSILASDPHLGLQIPSQWYALAQRGNTLDVKGMSLVGLPAIVFGRNNKIAWGGTAMMADVQDLVIETIDPNQSNHYIHDGESLPFETTEAIIKIRADFPSSLRTPEGDRRILIRRSRHGPIVSNFVNSVDLPVALQWTALGHKNTTYESLFSLSYASDTETLKEALALHVAPTLNIIFADKNGNIGLIGAGRIPIRSGVRCDGRLPTRAEDACAQWSGYIPADQLPQSLNPNSGYVLNANNANVPENYQHFISSKFASNYRANRIQQLIEENTHFLNVDYMKKMQTDTKDLSAADLLPLMLRVEPSSEMDAKVLQQLERWDGFAEPDSLGATIYYTWISMLRRELLADELNAYWGIGSDFQGAITNILPTQKIAQILTKKSEVCDKVHEIGTQTCELILQKSLGRTVKELTKIFGRNLRNWRWGKANTLVYRHTPFSDIRLMASVFERRAEGYGAQDTINVSAPSFLPSQGFESSFGASFRQIIEFGKNGTTHLIALPLGQSGQLASYFYDNSLKDYKQGKYVFFHDEPDSVSSITQLAPAQ